MMIGHASLNNSKLYFVGIAQYLIFYSKVHVQISRKSHDSIHIPDFTKRLINTFGIIGSRL